MAPSSGSVSPPKRLAWRYGLRKRPTRRSSIHRWRGPRRPKSDHGAGADEVAIEMRIAMVGRGEVQAEARAQRGCGSGTSPTRAQIGLAMRAPKRRRASHAGGGDVVAGPAPKTARRKRQTPRRRPAMHPHRRQSQSRTHPGQSNPPARAKVARQGAVRPRLVAGDTAAVVDRVAGSLAPAVIRAGQVRASSTRGTCATKMLRAQSIAVPRCRTARVPGRVPQKSPP